MYAESLAPKAKLTVDLISDEMDHDKDQHFSIPISESASTFMPQTSAIMPPPAPVAEPNMYSILNNATCSLYYQRKKQAEDQQWQAQQRQAEDQQKQAQERQRQAELASSSANTMLRSASFFSYEPPKLNPSYNTGLGTEMNLRNRKRKRTILQ